LKNKKLKKLKLNLKFSQFLKQFLKMKKAK